MRKTYLKMIKGNSAAVAGENTKKLTGEIKRMAQGVIDGNTHYYIVLEGHDDLILMFRLQTSWESLNMT